MAAPRKLILRNFQSPGDIVLTAAVRDLHRCHFIHGFMQYLNDRLGLRIRPTEFRGARSRAGRALRRRRLSDGRRMR